MFMKGFVWVLIVALMASAQNPDDIPDDKNKTTSTSTTSTSTTTTTTIDPNTTTTTTPPPTPNTKIYNVTENNLTCIMIDADINFLINYTTVDNKTSLATVSMPKHVGSVTGTCNIRNVTERLQEITVSWGVNVSFVHFVFNRTNDKWGVKNFTAQLFASKELFVNATDDLIGKTLQIEAHLNLNPNEIFVNHSYKCMNKVESQNVSASLPDGIYTSRITVVMDGLHLEAFNEIEHEEAFVDAIHCLADATSDVVPIAVGCALAGLVVIVLVAYLVGRRRRTASYQSV